MYEGRTRRVDLNTRPVGDVVDSVEREAVPASEVVSAEVRRIYCLCYRVAVPGAATYGNKPIPAYDGGEDDFGTHHKVSVWGKIAKVIVRHGLDPVVYIKAQFWVRGANARPPLANALYSDKAMDNYRAYCTEVPLSLELQRQRSLKSVQRAILPLTRNLRWEYTRAMRYALLDVRTVRATALFRYCMAMSAGFDDIAESYVDQATVQYVFQKEVYDATWSEWIPEVMREQGRVIRARIVDGR